MDTYKDSIDLCKFKGSARKKQKETDVYSTILHKVQQVLEANRDAILDPDVIHSVCIFIETMTRSSKKNKVDKQALLFKILEEAASRPISPEERKQAAMFVDFCLENRLIKAVPLTKLLLHNGLIFLKKIVL